MENLLKKEKSPYLKQHENNPVHWHPWNKKALDKAKELKKPIFICLIILIYSFLIFNNSFNFYKQEFEFLASLVVGLFFLKPS